MIGKKKKIVRYAFFCFVLIFLIGMTLAHFVFKPQFQELNVLVNKYCEMNIRQNSGIHQQVLVFIKRMTFFLPTASKHEIYRKKNEVGFGDYTSDKYLKNYQILHRKFVTTEQEILTAFNKAKPGTEIIIKPGIYKFKGRRILTQAAGKPFRPIIVRAATFGDVVFELRTQEGILISKPHWHIENIIFKGGKSSDGWIDHAIHLTGKANHIVIANNEFVNFNAHIKSNGGKARKGVRAFPSNVIIDHNTFYNEWKRNTKNSVTPIDVVGGSFWTVRNNFIADFGKNGMKGVGITYGAFLKGGGDQGVFEDNLVSCEWKLPHTSFKDIRIGLSLGGGGTDKNFCDKKNCKYEHDSGVIKNNVVVNCQNDVGIYINKASNSTIYNNVLKNNLGIDVRFSISNALIYNNYIDGRTKARDGAKIEEYDTFDVPR